MADWVDLKGRVTKAALLAVLCAGTLSHSSLTAQQSQPQPDQQQNPPKQDVPDAPSAAQPPEPSDKLSFPEPDSPSARPALPPSNQPAPSEDKATPPMMPPVKTMPPGSIPRQQNDSQDTLYKLVVTTNFVQVPVTVKNHDGQLVDGLLPRDFAVYENGVKQNLKFFSSDPFALSVAIVLDLGMPDIAVQKVNQTYSALVGAFAPYDEVGLYTYSSTVSQVRDFGGVNPKLTAVLNQIQTERGHNNGPAVVGGPFGTSGPMVNGTPVGGPPITPVYTPPKEAHVLNDAILRAALDLAKRDRTRRKIIFVISDGRESGSKAGYKDVLRYLLTNDIQVKAVAVDASAIPGYKELERIHLPFTGYGDLLPKYSSATGGGGVPSEFSRNAIEAVYADVIGEARNQYTLGYTPNTRGAGRRDIEVKVFRNNLTVFAKDSYYPSTTRH
jgi:VWFA-related protein